VEHVCLGSSVPRQAAGGLSRRTDGTAPGSVDSATYAIGQVIVRVRALAPQERFGLRKRVLNVLRRTAANEASL
jgi:hypothetical protein